MSWVAVVAALDRNERFRSRVSAYLHPMAGRPVIWHVVRAIQEMTPAPSSVRVLHHTDVPLELPNDPQVRVEEEGIAVGDEGRALRAAITAPGMTMLIDGAAPLLTPGTLSRLLRVGESGVATLHAEGHDERARVASAGEGPALASADDPRVPDGATPVASPSPDELLRVVDRRCLAIASRVMRDRLVQLHQRQGVTFLLPDTNWIDVDVRIGEDTVIYPGVVLEGMTEIGAECVIGPHSRIAESTIGKGVELKGWNYIARANVRNHAVVEPYIRRGRD